jgi:hypothetical protein
LGLGLGLALNLIACSRSFDTSDEMVQKRMMRDRGDKAVVELHSSGVRDSGQKGDICLGVCVKIGKTDVLGQS